MAKWIAGATEHSHGQFKAKAEKAGESTAEYAKEKASAPGKLGKQARLAETLMGLHSKGEKKKTERKAAGKKESSAHKMYPHME
jgi:transcription antitermination factor NusA-like protein